MKNTIATNIPNNFTNYKSQIDRGSLPIKRVLNGQANLSYGARSLLKLSRAYEKDMLYHSSHLKGSDPK